MAHSWTGNTVTNENWSNFWLNEGFTVYVQRKTSERVNGYDFAKVSSFIGNQSAYESMEDFGYWNSYSSLHPNVRSDSPDNAFSEIPYQKGYQFVYYLQSLLGEHLTGKMIDQYVAQNAFTSIKWQTLQASVESFIDANEAPASRCRWLKQQIDWETWVYGPGLAPVWQNFTTPLLIEAQ